MKNKIRKIHIDNQEWKYIILIKPFVQKISIFRPNKQIFAKISINDLLESVGDKNFICRNIKPSYIKNYILKKLEM